MRSLQRGFTLVELVVVIAILSIIVAIAIPALNSSKADTEIGAARAMAKTLNDARDRVIIKGEDGIESQADWTAAYGNDTEAASDYLRNGNYYTVRKEEDPLEFVEIVEGVFYAKGDIEGKIYFDGAFHENPYPTFNDLLADLGLNPDGSLMVTGVNPSLAGIADDPLKYQLFLDNLPAIAALAPSRIITLASDTAIDTGEKADAFLAVLTPTALAGASVATLNAGEDAATALLARSILPSGNLYGERTEIDFTDFTLSRAFASGSMLRTMKASTGQGADAYAGLNFSGMQINASQISNPTALSMSLVGTNVSGMDVGNWGTPLGTPRYLASGFPPVSTFAGMQNGTNFTNANLSNTTNTSAILPNLVRASAVSGLNLSGTGITRQAYIDASVAYLTGVGVNAGTATTFATNRANTITF